MVGHSRRIRVIRRRLSRSQHTAQKQDRTCNFFVRRVEKTTDDRPARSPCYSAGDADSLGDRPVVGHDASPYPSALGPTTISTEEKEANAATNDFTPFAFGST